jgi:hypothetical protein
MTGSNADTIADAKPRRVKVTSRSLSNQSSHGKYSAKQTAELPGKADAWVCGATTQSKKPPVKPRQRCLRLRVRLLL